MTADLAAYIIGVVSLCAIAILAVWTLVATLVPHWGQIVAALFGERGA